MASNQSPAVYTAPSYIATQKQDENQLMADEPPPGLGPPPPITPPLLRQDACRYKTINREHHGEITYCIDWSSDVYAEEEEEEEEDDETNSYRIIATCGSRHVNIYKVATGKDKASRKSPLDWIQSYVDADKKESYFACAFAGRSVELTEQEEAQLAANKRRGKATRRDDNSKRPVKLQRRNPAQKNHSANGTPTLSPNWPLSGETGTGTQLLCVAGHKAVIQVIDTSRQELVATLVGHGMEIYDLKVCPTDEFVLVSGSKDNTARLWNLKTGAQIAVIAGHEGHLDDVVSIAWHPSGNYLATGSMDTTVKLWDVGPNTPVHSAIQESHQAAKVFLDDSCQIITQPVEQSIPIFTSHKLHFHCVDSVAFWGDCIVSRSLGDVIFLWEPIDFCSSQNSAKFTVAQAKSTIGAQGTPQEKLPYPIPTAYRHLRSFVYRQSDFWFVRFAVDRCGQTLAAGNGEGQIYIWDLSVRTNGSKVVDGSSEAPSPIQILETEGKNRQNAIRYLSFSPDDDFLVAVSDNGATYKWDVQREKVSNGGD